MIDLPTLDRPSHHPYRLGRLETRARRRSRLSRLVSGGELPSAPQTLHLIEEIPGHLVKEEVRMPLEVIQEL